MRIVATDTTLNTIAYNVATALQSIGENISLWNTRQKPVFDMIAEKRPDVIIIHTDDMTPIFMRAIKEYSNISVIAFGFSNCYDNIDVVCLPDNTPEHVMKNLSIDNAQILLIPPTANIAKYGQHQYHASYASDVLYISKQKPSAALINILHHLAAFVQIKICGPIKIAMPEYLGVTNLSQEIRFMSSTRIGLDFYGLDTLDYASLGTYCVTPAPNPVFPSVIPTQIVDTILDKVENLTKLKTLANKAKKLTYKKYTCFHITQKIFTQLNYPHIVSKLQKRYEQIRQTS